MANNNQAYDDKINDIIEGLKDIGVSFTIEDKIHDKQINKVDISDKAKRQLKRILNKKKSLFNSVKKWSYYSFLLFPIPLICLVLLGLFTEKDVYESIMNISTKNQYSIAFDVVKGFLYLPNLICHQSQTYLGLNEKYNKCSKDLSEKSQSIDIYTKSIKRHSDNKKLCELFENDNAKLFLLKIKKDGDYYDENNIKELMIDLKHYFGLCFIPNVAIDNKPHNEDKNE